MTGSHETIFHISVPVYKFHVNCIAMSYKTNVLYNSIYEFFTHWFNVYFKAQSMRQIK